MSHPGNLNALTTAMWHQLRQCFLQIAGHSELRVVVIQGAGEAFAAGADISEFARVRATREQVIEFHEQMIAPALASIVHCPLPVVAAIDGPCVGGGLEIASVCDIRVASDRSRFGIPINRLGFPLAPAEAAGLVSLVGRAVSLELLLEGRILNAEEAYDKGLVSRVVPAALWADEVKATLDRICAGAPHAARRNKRLIHLLSELSDTERLSSGQRDACWDFVDTQDYARGLKAFLSKTKPTFEDN
jgi:enoyl-CoA hydratase/carnithine racemase